MSILIWLTLLSKVMISSSTEKPKMTEEKTTDEGDALNTLNLTCSFNNSFIWAKFVFNTSMISGSKTATLITHNGTGEVSGQYMCTVQHQNATLTRKVNPTEESVKTPTVAGESTIRRDGSLNLTCTGGSFPSFFITWTKRGINKTPNSETPVIHNVTKEHSGRYFCSANHMNKTLVQDINVTVIYAKKPEITGDPTVKEGDILNLTCTVESFPPSRITWSKLGINKSLTSDSSLDTRTSTLVTHNETTEDPGQYFCTATPLNSSTQGIIITMIDLEKLKTTEENTTHEGDTLNLSCRINGSFIWTKLVFNTSMISGTGAARLITYNVTGEASGQYMCTAQYQYTTPTVTVVSENEFTRGSTFKRDGSLNLTCTGGSLPSFFITWTKQGINKTPNSETGPGTSTLVINNVTKEHSGRYICSANHMNKTLVQDINVTVIYAKKPEITGDPTVKEGDILNLTCTVESFPPSRITWSKLGINKSLTSDGSLDTRTSTLVTHNETTEDPGQYFCTATPLNRSTQGIIITMIDLEKLKTTEENTTHEGDTLNLTCRFNGSFIWTKLVFNTSMISGTGAARLITYNVTGEASSQYMCTAQYQNTTPTVTVVSENESVNATKVTHGSTFKRDGSLSLNCTGGTFPSFFITWTKQGINKTPNSETGPGTSTLVINNVTKEHSGRYFCSANHMNKTLVQDINVTVILLPTILDESGCEAKLETLTCLCISQGFPSPTITWEPLVNHIEYSVNTAVSNHTVRSTLSLNVKNHSSISPVCVSSNRNVEVRRKFNIITVEDEGHITKLLRTLKQMETLIPFLIGLLLSAAIFCLFLLCFRKRQKPRGSASETLEMVMMQETNGGHAEDYEPIQPQGTAAVSESPEGATPETEYSDINVLLLKQDIPSSVEEKPKTADTDYAKIKTKGERMKEEGEAQEEEEVKLEDVAVYSVVTKEMGHRKP